MNKAVGAGRADSIFVKAHRVTIVALDASNFSADKRRAVLEIVRAIVCPSLELFVMRRKSFHVLLPLSGWRGIARGRSG